MICLSLARAMAKAKTGTHSLKKAKAIGRVSL